MSVHKNIGFAAHSLASDETVDFVLLQFAVFNQGVSDTTQQRCFVEQQEVNITRQVLSKNDLS